MKKISKELLFVSEVFNYSCKGIVAGLGKGEGVTKKVKLLFIQIKKSSTIEALVQFLVSTKLIEDGDIVAFPSKIISILEKQYVYGLTIENYKRCTSDLEYARKTLKTEGSALITDKDIIGMDKLDAEKKIGVIYPENPNKSAHIIADKFFEVSGSKIDVVITDSDSGAEKGMKLINCPTIINTPIGATKGLGLFYSMRVAVAAEINWNNVENAPVFLVKPYQASRLRKNIGELKYNGFLNAEKEDDYKKFIR